MRNLRVRWLNFRLRNQPTVCQSMGCGEPLPPLPVERRYCSEKCRDDDWWQSQV